MKSRGIEEGGVVRVCLDVYPVGYNQAVVTSKRWSYFMPQHIEIMLNHFYVGMEFHDFFNKTHLMAFKFIVSKVTHSYNYLSLYLMI